MAKGSKSKSTGRRDHNTITTPRVHSRPFASSTPPRVHSYAGPPGIEDGRVWHPDGDARPAYEAFTQKPIQRPQLVDRAKSGSTKSGPSKRLKRALQASINRYGYKWQSKTKAILAFADPKKTAICIRRAARKTIMHATGYAGIKNHRFKRPKRSRWSSTSCR